MTTLPEIPLPSALTPRSVVRWGQTFLPSWSQDAWWNGRQRAYQMWGVPHEWEFQALNELLLDHRDPHVLDLGANRGQSIDSVRLVLGRNVRITAVEPSGRLASRLKNRYPEVDVRQVAVGNARGSFDLYTPSYRGFRYDGLASCDEWTAREWFRYSIWRYRSELVTVEREQVNVVRVDDLRLDVDFIKVDVQGMEMAALRGAEVTLTRQRPVVMVETPDQEVYDFFAGLGYKDRYWVSNGLTCVRPQWPLNVFFVP